MMKVIILAMTVLFSFISCSKSSEDIPSCIQSKIEEQKELSSFYVKKVYKFTKDGKDFFWFNTEAVHVDGVEYIYNEDCTEACHYCGFCLQPDCIKDFPDYGSSQWTEVWKP